MKKCWAALMLLFVFCIFCMAALADEPYWDGTGYEFDFANEDYEGLIILDDPEYFMDVDEEEAWMIAEEDVLNATATDLRDTEPSAVPAASTALPERPEESEPEEPELAAETHAPRAVKREPVLHEIPQAYLDADPTFAALMAEAEKCIGYPYVWGGSKPETSFDCSGFVSWVFTQSGVYNTGRKGATGLYNLCTAVSSEEVRPGDLVFFEGTMGPDVPGVTHVGIYVGDGWMIHCGDPIGYADLTEERWVKRFYAFGRLPLGEGDADEQ